jgi:hypothetical protein
MVMACELIPAAEGAGACLIAFQLALIPTFPVWAWPLESGGTRICTLR